MESKTMHSFTDEEMAVYERAKNGDGIVNTFIGEWFCGDAVMDKDAAMACIFDQIDRIGGDETTVLVHDSTLANDNGMTVVTFAQRAGDILVNGSTVKLVIDANNIPIAIVSSIMPNVRIRPIEEWAINGSQAEQVVMDKLRAEGATDTLIEGATEQIIIPMPDDIEHYVCAWVVHTLHATSPSSRTFTAHYVSVKGDYLYSMPVSTPGDPNAEKGQSAMGKFNFDAYESDEMAITVQLRDGSAQEVFVPVLKDAAAGKTYLADAKRKVLCADQSAYFNDGTIKPVEVQDGVDLIDAHTYYTYLRIWDFYDEVGWTGPDDQGTPTLLLMNFVDMEGKPLENAAYITKYDGFQVFAFTRAADFGECLDIMAHEYTHCVTSTTMKFNPYKYDPGAINEGMSDVLGNIIEIMLEGGADAWTIGEGLGANRVERNMANPHECAQPEFAFDTFYAPRPPVATEMNDRGGVHTNSSLLNIVSYRLYQAGMAPSEQGFFWMSAALVLSPQTDYPMLAEILPWVMNQVGYDQYIEPLVAAIDEAKFTVTEDPGTVAEGCGSATFDFAPIKESADNGLVCLSFFEAPDANPKKRADTWPVAGTTVAKANLPAGDYYVVAVVGDSGGMFKKYMAFGDDGWKLINGKDSETIKMASKSVTVEAGKVVEVPNDTFGSVATEQLKVIEQALSEQDEA